MAATDRRSRARLAIQTLATDLNLPTELIILSERWNTVARLGESEVIAKAATLAQLSRLDPLHWFEQETRVSAELVAAGAPVQVPWNGPTSFSVIDGLPITLWQRIEGETAGSSEKESVESLAAIHRLGEGIEHNQPWFATITVEIPGTLSMLADRGELDSVQTAMLRDHLSRSLDRVDRSNLPTGFVHGDAQRKNSMHTSEGTIWIDLEETCRAPLAWDLACLTMNPHSDADRVLDGYADASGTDRVSTENLDGLKQLRRLEGLVWMLAIQHEREPGFQQETQSQLASMLQEASAG